MVDAYIQNLLGDRERIVLIAHQHVFMLLASMAWEILSMIVLLVGVTVIYLSGVTMAVYAYALLIIPFIGMIVDAAAWSNRQFVITNRRVLQVFGIFNKDVTDSSLEKVNDVKMDQSVLGRIFNYGDIEILTASELGANLFKRIHDPVRFKTAMLNAREEMAMPENGSTLYREMDARGIPDMIARLDLLRRQGAITEEEFQQKKADLLRRIE